MIKCVTGKKTYVSEQLAEEALIEAQTRFHYAKGQGPIAVYQCEDCGYFHLTSKGSINKKLAQQLEQGNIHRQKEVDEWLKKMKLKK